MEAMAFPWEKSTKGMLESIRVKMNVFIMELN